MLKPFTRYEPDVDALRSGTPRIVIAVGAASRGEAARPLHGCPGRRLGTPPAIFPG